MVGMELYDFFGPIEEYVFFIAARNTRIRNSDKMGIFRREQTIWLN